MLHFLYVIAIIAEAMSASFSAGRRDMDYMGVVIIAWVTALGGGTIRNLMLGHYPMTWVEHPIYLVLTAVAALITTFASKRIYKLTKTFLILDAIGLVVFTILGCKLAIEMKMDPIIIIISGMVTGCAGGIMRDILCNDVPLIFQKEIYASVALVTGGVYLLTFYYIGSEFHLDTIFAFIVGLTLRFLAVHYEWSLPKFSFRDDNK